MTIKMNPTVDRMLGLTADIAEELLLVKDAGYDTLPDGLKLKIISLAELAATVDSTADAEPYLADAEERPVEAMQDETMAPAPEPVTAPAPQSASVADIVADDVADATVDAELTEGADAMQAEESAEADAIEESSHCEMPDCQDTVGGESINEESDEEADEVVDDADEAVAETSDADDATPEAASAEFEEEEDADVAEETGPQPVRRIDPAAIYQAFSINDAFFFRREIFGGSREQFFESLVRISTLPDRRALQEYLVEHLGLNLNQSPGKEFYNSIVVFF